MSIRRIYFNDEDYKILQNLKSQQPFKKLTNLDIFSLSLVYGQKAGFRTPLHGHKSSRINEKTIERSNAKYLMMAAAVDEYGSLNFLSDENDFIQISEEYAKTGISLLEKDYMENPNKFIEKLELEALEYYDKYIEE